MRSTGSEISSSPSVAVAAGQRRAGRIAIERGQAAERLVVSICAWLAGRWSGVVLARRAGQA